MGTRPVHRLKHTFLCHFKCIQTKQCKCFILAWCTLACSTCLPVKATNSKLVTGCLTTGEKYIKLPIEEILGPGAPCPAEQYQTSRSSVGNSEKVPLLSGERGTASSPDHLAPGFSELSASQPRDSRTPVPRRQGQLHSLSPSASWLVSGEDEIRDYIYSPCPVISFYRSQAGLRFLGVGPGD